MDGSGKKLRRLHNVLAHHLRVLNVKDCELSSFVTSLIQMKLDQSTSFEWQRHIQGASKVPHHGELLKFLDLPARASEYTTREGIKRLVQSMPHMGNAQLKPAYFVSAVNSCTMCNGTKHPLYMCRKFRSLSHNQHITTVRNNQLCFNCLKSGHLKQQCPPLQRSQVCQRPYYTLLHLGNDKDAPWTTAGSRSPPRSHWPPAAMSEQSTLCSHIANHQWRQGQVMVMTCQALVMTPEWRTMQERAMLDSASLTSFIMERLAQCLWLCHENQHIQIAGIFCHTSFVLESPGYDAREIDGLLTNSGSGSNCTP